MIPLIDMHCHLLAGLDDGPATEEDALAMCRLAYSDGTRMVAATAHQNDEYPEVTPERIRSAWERLVQLLHEAGIPLAVFPNAEVMVHAEVVSAWTEGRLLSVADRGRYLLIEQPHGCFLDLEALIRKLVAQGVRPIIAHAERQEELLHDAGQIERLIEAGGVVQVNASSVARPRNRNDAKALKDWFKRGIVHCLGSDGHSLRRRPPVMSAAYQQVRLWAGHAIADRVCSTWGMAILQGLPLKLPRPEPRGLRWFAGWWPKALLGRTSP
jgi:protein-tyrosine phosphatase